MPGNATAQHGFAFELFVAPFVEELPVSQAEVSGAVEVPQVISIDVPIGTFNSVKTTHLKSPKKYHEKIPGFGDGGRVTVRCNYSESLAYQIVDLVPSPTAQPPSWGRCLFAAVMPDGGTAIFQGFVAGGTIGVPEDDRVTLQFEIEVSGPINWALGS